ncbi:hypothetical protein DWF74_04535 [Pseudomonas protegens]|nr:hypothetical protein DWF74_04535 [Pseudomonas protegens]
MANAPWTNSSKPGNSNWASLNPSARSKRRPVVGARLLAEDLNDNPHSPGIGGALESIASKLAPTDGH